MITWLLFFLGGAAVGGIIGWRWRNREVEGLATRLEESSTRLKQASAEEARQRGRLESMLRSLTAGVVAVDSKDRVQFVNPTFEAWCGRPESEILGQSLLEVLRHHDLSKVLADAREGGAEQSREMVLRGPTERAVDVRAAPLKIDGQASGAVAVLYDVTDLRRLERIRQDFVANVSHELRTPLAAIRGAVETLVDGAAKEPKQREVFLSAIQEHALRLERLVEDLLDLSLVERRPEALDRKPVALKPLVDRVIGLLRDRVSVSKVTVVNRVEDACPDVVGDVFRLEQVFLNVIENALKFSPPKGEVDVEGRAEGDRVTVTVRDHGIGIPAKDLPRVFERFYRVDKARSRALGGTGLGLSLVKHLVEAHGGDVRIESEEEKGTCVIIHLPSVIKT